MTEKAKNLFFYLFFPCAFIISEFAVRLSIYGFRFDLSLIFILLFSTAAGFLCAFICSLFNQRANFIISVVITALIFIMFSFQLVYYKFFRSFFLWETLGLAGDVTQFWKSALFATLKQWYMIIFLALPLVILIVYRKKLFSFDRKSKPYILQCAGASAVLIICGCLLTLINPYYRTCFFGAYSADECVGSFGLTANSVLEIKSMIFSPDTDTYIPADDTPEPVETPKVIEYNVMDIDFESLIQNEDNEKIKEMHKYFASCAPSEKNEYTGLFKGKNLIVLTLEGFTDKCIDPVLTPTLYKMANEGFIFDNFYNSLWGGSTASGEYAAMSGNFYTKATALKEAGDNSWPFMLGHQFAKLGYVTKAYHNHTYTYYGRDKSHTAFGYDYKGVGNGMTGITKQWPESDLEMAISTAPEYIDQEQPFHVYYMTVSGHCEYSFNDNMMCYKNKELVKDLPCSKEVQAYYACQIELDRALKSLINQLSDAGKLENTVFAMCADHYPYALSEDALSELYSLPRDGILNNFDLYRNGFILWTASMTEPLHIAKPCSAIDILPTLSNLFGLEFDSRLMTGTDILSEKDAPVILNSVGTIGSNHWITSNGSYNARKGEFTPSPECTLEGEELENYISSMKSTVLAKEKYSPMILDYDYYRYLP